MWGLWQWSRRWWRHTRLATTYEIRDDGPVGASVWIDDACLLRVTTHRRIRRSRWTAVQIATLCAAVVETFLEPSHD